MEDFHMMKKSILPNLIHRFNIIPIKNLSKQFFFFWLGLEFELQASHLQSRHSSARVTPPVRCALVILETGSGELFPWAGFILISASPVARITGVSHQRPFPANYFIDIN
jgi:hypothetical protein